MFHNIYKLSPPIDLRGRMIADSMEKMFNEQIAAETASAALYWAMGSFLRVEDYPGMAHHMECRAKEGLRRSILLYRQLLARGGRPSFGPASQPPSSWDGPMHVFRSVFAHEERVSAKLHSMVDMAIEARDHASHQFLMPLVGEQVGLLADARSNLARLRKIGDDRQSLLSFDDALATRPLPFLMGIGEE